MISPQPLTDLVPLHRTKNDEIVTAYDMKAIEKLGLLKMDFLGLTTLTIIDDALRLIVQTRGERLNLQTLALDDTETYEKVFHTGLTSGVFQFESHGMRDVLRRYKPTTVEDLTALNALYRPGPIQGGMIDDFIDRKWGRKKIEYELPELEVVLKETLGVIVYQEQVMQIANRLAGYSLGEADLLRRAMGKKDADEMAKQRERFVKGANERGFPEKKIDKIFDLMEQFAGYGFNKSHSAAYALLAYHTAYLKTHYPVEFMAALLTSVSGSTDDVVKYINECREMGIPVEPPDVNVSAANFTPHGDAIRFGLSAVKNVGHNAIESIVAARTEIGAFKSIFQFCEKVDLRLLNKRVIESLIKSGAMDAMGRRSQLMAVVDSAMEHAQKSQRDAAMGQHGLFGVFAEDDGPQKEKPLPNIPDWDEHQRLSAEKEILGFFITGPSAGEVQGQTAGLQRADHRRPGADEVLDRTRRKRTRGRHPEGRARLQVEEGRSLRARPPGRHDRLGGHPVLFGVVQAPLGEAQARRARAGEGKRAHRRGLESQADDQRHHSAGRRAAEIAAQPAHQDPAGDGIRGDDRCAALDLCRAKRRGQGAV